MALWNLSRCDKQRPRRCGRNENRELRATHCRRLTLRSATGFSQRENHHPGL
jgi:hypothetical protein